jgi:hypothetical protein
MLLGAGGGFAGAEPIGLGAGLEDVGVEGRARHARTEHRLRRIPPRLLPVRAAVAAVTGGGAGRLGCPRGRGGLDGAAASHPPHVARQVPVKIRYRRAHDHNLPFQCTITYLFASFQPTAQALLAEVAATAANSNDPGGLGLRTCFQVVPFQCMMSVFGPV